MTAEAEEVLAELLAPRIGSLGSGRHRVMFEGVVSDGVGGWRDGRHPVGWVERVSSDALRIRLLSSTEAGRTAKALLEEGLLDAALTNDYPPVIRLLSDEREALRSPYVFRVGPRMAATSSGTARKLT